MAHNLSLAQGIDSCRESGASDIAFPIPPELAGPKAAPQESRRQYYCYPYMKRGAIRKARSEYSTCLLHKLPTFAIMNGNSSQTTSSQQPIANGSAILASTSVPNGIGRPNPPLLFTNFKKKWLSIFKYWVKFTVALLIYGATLYIAWSASKRHTLLGLASPQLGIWILSIFAKAGDITFAFAVQDTFDIFAWRKLKQRQGVSGPENFGGIKLVWFLSMVSSTGVLGLIRILWRTVIKSVFINVFRVVFRKKKARQQAGGLLGPNPNGHISEKRTWRQWWKNGAFARWSFIRLLFIVILIPGSGIILMGEITPFPAILPVIK